MLRSSKVWRNMGQYGGAAGSWFGNSKYNMHWTSFAKPFLICVFGIGCINWIMRGNFMGYCDNQTQIEIPVRSRTFPPPFSHGFVSATDLEK
ncbi:unnamed protein product [Phytomonas sp. Hart1]|nr:unnamed protein product [Phytomonas sp. Hart1]|eukprot:CCW70877.1 unnamed protein product [Phytomonas sp. isolate Hart1]